MLTHTVGVHPHNTGRCEDDALPQLRQLAGRSAAVAVGETGLDYNRDFSPRAVQRTWFERHVELAVEVGKPLFLHERDAHEDFVAILGGFGRDMPAGVVHCFTGGRREMERYLELGLHIGITGWICDERRGTHLLELVRAIPPQRLLIETDAPFLLPRSIRPRPKSRRNEPMYLPHVLATVAEQVGRPLEVVAAETRTATEQLFGLPTAPPDTRPSPGR